MGYLADSMSEVILDNISSFASWSNMMLRAKERVKATGLGLGTRVTTPVSPRLKAPQSNLLGPNPKCRIAAAKVLHTPVPALSKGIMAGPSS